MKELSQLNTFFNDHKCGEGQSSNITSLSGGKYSIPIDEFKTLAKLLSDDLKLKKVHNLVQKPCPISCICLDFDFRQNSDDSVRKYNIDDINKILRVCFDFLDEKIELTNDNSLAYVLERKEPYYYENKGKQYYKDGIHIIFPYLQCNKKLKGVLIEHLQKNLKFLEEKGYTNSLNDIVDKSILNNYWMIYGNSKPKCEKYELTYVIDKDLEYGNQVHYVEDIINELSVFHNDKYDVIYKDITLTTVENDFLKVDKVDNINNININDKHLVSKDIDKKEKKFKKDKKIESKTDKSDIEFAKELVNILDIKRSDNYENWIKLGWVLYNIDKSLLNVWDNFSKKSSKYQDNKCSKLWSNMKRRNFSIGTLIMWAKEDNYEKYRSINSTRLRSYIEIATNKTSYRSAEILYKMYKGKYVCVSKKNKGWFMFKDHKWVSIEEGITLRKKISTSLFDEVVKINDKISDEMIKSDDEKKEILTKKKKKLDDLCLKLLDTSFKENIMKECMELFYDEELNTKFDENKDLLCFKNGVYDFNNEEFRDGRPEDCITLCTNIDYIEYDEESPYVKELYEIITKIQPNKEIREFVLGYLASCLQGNIIEQKFNIWIGSGANGKSMILDLVDDCLGDYSFKLPVSYLTSKRKSSGQATPEISRAMGKRLAVLQEPDKDEVLNCGLMKETSGGDKLYARPLYGIPFEFMPQFKMILTCNNIPEIKSDDYGTWRRIRCVEYKSKFVDEPDVNNENEYLRDNKLVKKLKQIEYKEAFMSILINRFKLYKINEDGLIPEPLEVKKHGEKIKNECDIFSNFVNDTLEEKKGNFIKITKIYQLFKTWYKESYGSSNIPRQIKVKESISKILGDYSQRGWKNWDIRCDESDTESDDDYNE